MPATCIWASTPARRPSNPSSSPPDGALLLTRYQSNSGDPVPHVRGFLTDLRTEHPNWVIRAGAVTGYGEDLIQKRVRRGFRSGRNRGALHRRARFMPNVDFIIDIGGQDIKMLQDSQRRDRQHLPQRGLFLRLRLVFANVRQRAGIQD